MQTSVYFEASGSLLFCWEASSCRTFRSSFCDLYCLFFSPLWQLERVQIHTDTFAWFSIC